MTETLYELAVELLTDPKGISGEAWELLYSLLENSDMHRDFVRQITGDEGRIWLPHNHTL